jgi:ribonuclease G
MSVTRYDNSRQDRPQQNRGGQSRDRDGGQHRDGGQNRDGGASRAPQQPPKKEILVSSEFRQTKVAILENGQLEEFYIEHAEDQQLVGSIYKGKVSSIIPGIGASFISLGLEKNGFLYVGDVAGETPSGLSGDSEYEDIDAPGEARPRQDARDRRQDRIQDLLQKDQEILVQVVKEPFGTKGARLTGEITLPGRYVVLMPYHHHRGISKRIEDSSERARIREIVQGLEIPKDCGLIVRTAAWGCSKDDLARDVRFLLHQWKLIQRRYQVMPAPALLHEEHGIVLRMIRDVFNEKFHGITLDSPEEFRKARRYLQATMPHYLPKLHMYKGDVPVFALKNIDREIEKIFESKAMLKSGGSIVIEQTEALVSIDVNTGKFIGKHNLEDTAFRTNCEAAREIAKQIRLRDMGGIIIIDFIDMENPEHRRQVLRILEDSLRRDRAKTSVLNLSQLGLVEMTRQRMRKSLQTTNSQVCPYCAGKGIVKSNKRLAIEALQKAEAMMKKNKTSEVEITVTPEVAEVLLKAGQQMLKDFEKKHRCKIGVMVDTNLQPEEIRLKRVMDKRRLPWLEGIV